MEVDAPYPVSKTYFFYWDCERDDFAELLTKHLKDHLYNEIQRIRREEYNLGWKDAKSKKVAKRTWFKGWF